MAIARLTLMKPRPERVEEITGHLQELVDYLDGQKGCLGAYVVTSEGPGQEVGRLTLWETEEDASRMAQDPHVLAIHAEIHFDVHGQHQDWTFQASPPQASATSRP